MGICVVVRNVEIFQRGGMLGHVKSDPVCFQPCREDADRLREALDEEAKRFWAWLRVEMRAPTTPDGGKAHWSDVLETPRGIARLKSLVDGDGLFDLAINNDHRRLGWVAYSVIELDEEPKRYVHKID